MARTFVVDSTNTARLVRRLFVVDSTNTARLIQRAFAIDSTNTARLVYAAVKVFPAALSSFGTTTVGNPISELCSITFSAAGQEIAFASTSGGGTLGNWCPTNGGSGFQIMCTLSSGTAPNQGGATNTLNTWITASSDLSWGLSLGPSSGNITNACTLLFQVRAVGGTVILSSGTITMSNSISNNE
jgi:hypothetical protein